MHLDLALFKLAKNVVALALLLIACRKRTHSIVREHILYAKDVAAFALLFIT